MSPEQALGQPDVDARTDVYAIGVMLYEALAGRPPIAGSSPSEVIGRLFTEVPPPVRQFSPGLPPPIDALVARAIAKDRAARFDDCPAARAPRSRANPRVPRLPHLPQQPHPLPQAPNPHRPNRPP
jgi:serine/threonine-protein kinase